MSNLTKSNEGWARFQARTNSGRNKRPNGLRNPAAFKPRKRTKQ